MIWNVCAGAAILTLWWERLWERLWERRLWQGLLQGLRQRLWQGLRQRRLQRLGGAEKCGSWNFGVAKSVKSVTSGIVTPSCQGGYYQNWGGWWQEMASFRPHLRNDMDKIIRFHVYSMYILCAFQCFQKEHVTSPSHVTYLTRHFFKYYFTRYICKVAIWLDHAEWRLLALSTLT